jgi:hypothetical protein
MYKINPFWQISTSITSLVKDHRAVKNYTGRDDRWTGFGDVAENLGNYILK